MKKSSVGILGDLTALFAARSFLKKNINYMKLNEQLKEYLGVENFGMTKFFTLYHPNNEKQVEFLKFLKEELNWEVITTTPLEIKQTQDYRNYRFDVPIAYHLGVESVSDEFDKLVVISDSIELVKSMKEAAYDIPGGVYLAFYSEALDRRWVKMFAGENSKLKFIDLDELEYTKPKPVEPEDNDNYGRFEDEV